MKLKERFSILPPEKIILKFFVKTTLNGNKNHEDGYTAEELVQHLMETNSSTTRRYMRDKLLEMYSNGKLLRISLAKPYGGREFFYYLPEKHKELFNEETGNS